MKQRLFPKQRRGPTEDSTSGKTRLLVLVTLLAGIGAGAFVCTSGTSKKGGDSGQHHDKKNEDQDGGQKKSNSSLRNNSSGINNGTTDKTHPTSGDLSPETIDGGEEDSEDAETPPSETPAEKAPLCKADRPEDMKALAMLCSSYRGLAEISLAKPDQVSCPEIIATALAVASMQKMCSPLNYSPLTTDPTVTEAKKEIANAQSKLAELERRYKSPELDCDELSAEDKLKYFPPPEEENGNFFCEVDNDMQHLGFADNLCNNSERSAKRLTETARGSEPKSCESYDKAITATRVAEMVCQSATASLLQDKPEKRGNEVEDLSKERVALEGEREGCH